MDFKIYKIENKEVYTPSDDYYARRGDSSIDTIRVLVECDTFSNMEDALNALKSDNYSNGDYTILPIYTVK